MRIFISGYEKSGSIACLSRLGGAGLFLFVRELGQSFLGLVQLGVIGRNQLNIGGKLKIQNAVQGVGGFCGKSCIGQLAAIQPHNCTDLNGGILLHPHQVGIGINKARSILVIQIQRKLHLSVCFGFLSVIEPGSSQHPFCYTGGSIAPATPTNGSGEYSVRYWATYIDGAKVREIDPLNFICVVNGVDYLADVRKAIGK